MSKMQSILSMALMMSALSEEGMGRHRDFYDDGETEEEKKFRLEKAERSRNKAKGLTEFFYSRGSLWALNKKSADKKAKNKGWL